MRLLNINSKKLVFFNNEREVPGGYAILSHTWQEEEVTFQEVESDAARRKQGYRKINYTCQQAGKDGLKYAWLDTCELTRS